MKESIISSLEFTEIREVEQGIWHWICFKANEVDYYLMLLQDTKDKNHYYINGVFHEEDKCPLCSDGFVQSETCPVLNKEAKALLPRLIERTQNRLRWLTKTVHRMEGNE